MEYIDKYKLYCSFIGEYIVIASRCEKLVAMLIASKHSLKIEELQSHKYSLNKNIRILEKILPQYSQHLFKDRNLIKELDEMRELRNFFAHGNIYIDDNGIHMTEIGEINPKNGEWGFNLIRTFALGEFSNLITLIDNTEQYLLMLYNSNSYNQSF